MGENERQKEIRMKAKLELVIRDEDGNILSQLDPYVLELGSQSLDDIEGAVENWRQKILPDIEADLLSQARSPVQATGKKTVNSSVMALVLSTLRLYMENLSCSYRNIRCQVKAGATSSSVTN